MHVIDVNQLFSTSFYTFDRCIKEGGKNGADAFALYTFYTRQSKIQNNCQNWTLNAFVRKGLGWGDDRVKKAKAILKKLGLIDEILIRNEKGVFTGHYIRVNYLIDENDIRSTGTTYNLSSEEVFHQMEVPSDGETDTNTLYINNKYPKQKINADFFEKIWNTISTKRGGDEEKGLKEFEKKMAQGLSAEDMIKVATLDKMEIREGIGNIQYSQYKENWIHTYSPQSEEVMESRIINILHARYMRYLKGTKFKKDANTIADLGELFGLEYINGLRKKVQDDYKQHN